MKKYFPALEYVNIPNAFTSFGLVFGVAACFYLSAQNIRGVYVCIFFASLMDMLDGMLAAKLGQKTLFGQYADTIADFFICCVLPSMIFFTFIGGGVFYAAALALYCVCGMWRLAYFTVTSQEKRDYYTGLPVPSAMLFTTIAMWFAIKFGLPVWVCAAIIIISSVMMVSYFKLKKYGIWQKLLWAAGLGFLILILIK